MPALPYQSPLNLHPRIYIYIYAQSKVESLYLENIGLVSPRYVLRTVWLLALQVPYVELWSL